MYSPFILSSQFLILLNLLAASQSGHVEILQNWFLNERAVGDPLWNLLVSLIVNLLTIGVSSRSVLRPLSSLSHATSRVIKLAMTCLFCDIDSYRTIFSDSHMITVIMLAYVRGAHYSISEVNSIE